MTRQIWDISPAIHPAAPVFPGDTPYSQEWVASIGQAARSMSAPFISPHVGAHADAPLHYDAQGAAIGAVDLDAFLGPAA
jgi:arylformamidase